MTTIDFNNFNAGVNTIGDNVSLVWIDAKNGLGEIERRFYREAFPRTDEAFRFLAMITSFLETDTIEDIDNPLIWLHSASEVIALNEKRTDQYVSLDFLGKTIKNAAEDINGMFASFLSENFHWVNTDAACEDTVIKSSFLIKSYITKGNEGFLVYVEADVMDKEKKTLEILTAKAFDIHAALYFSNAVSQLTYHRLPAQCLQYANRDSFQKKLFPDPDKEGPAEHRPTPAR